MTHPTRLQLCPVCPHCGHHHADAWEWNFGSGLEGTSQRTCDSCEMDFDCDRVVDISYTTRMPHPAIAKATGDK